MDQLRLSVESGSRSRAVTDAAAKAKIRIQERPERPLLGHTGRQKPRCRFYTGDGRHTCSRLNYAGMCNEFRFKQALDKIAEEFSQLRLPIHWVGGAPNLEPRDSIRPTDPAAIVLGTPDGPELKQLRWGFPRDKGGPLIRTSCPLFTPTL